MTDEAFMALQRVLHPCGVCGGGGRIQREDSMGFKYGPCDVVCGCCLGTGSYRTREMANIAKPKSGNSLCGG